MIQLRERAVWRVTAFIAFLQSLYAVAFIIRSSVIVEGKRYFCLFDDAMISMRYAYNWAQGNGLVWNIGERVEGYTNFLWTIILGICHLPRLPQSQTCCIVQILGGLILLSCLIITCRISIVCKLHPLSSVCSVVMVATYYELDFFTLLGMETGIVTVFVSLALLRSVESINGGVPRPSAVLWFVPAILARPDTIILMLSVFVYLWTVEKKDKSYLIKGLFGAFAIIAAHLFWRHSYYGEWFPNTYYLKATNWPFANRILIGIKSSLFTFLTLAVPLGLSLIAVKKRQDLILLLSCCLIMISYQIYIGGDSFPLSRFIIPTSLGLFIATSEGLYRLAVFIKEKKPSLSFAYIWCFLIAITLLFINGIHLDHLFLINPPQQTEGNRINIMYVQATEKISNPDATVAVFWAGTFPYFSRRYCHDILGKSDPYIAKLPADLYPRAGHNKSDFGYSLFTKKPDIILRGHNVLKGVFLTNLRDRYTDSYQPIVVKIDTTDLPLVINKSSEKLKKSDLNKISWQELVELGKGIP